MTTQPTVTADPNQSKPTGQGVQQGSAAASSLALLGAVVTTTSNFLIAYLVSRRGAEVAGLFFVSTAVITVIGNMSCLGTMTGLVFHLPQTLDSSEPNPRGLLAVAVRPVLLASISAAVVLFWAAPTVGSILADNQAEALTTMLRGLAFVIPFWAITLSLLGATRGLGTMTPTVVVNQVLRPGGQMLILSVVFWGERLPPTWQVAAGWGLPVIVAFVVAVVLTGRLGGFKGGPRQLVNAEEFWRYTRPRSVSAALQIALERLDVVVISALIGESAAGVYGALTRYINAGNFVIFSISQAVSALLRRSIFSSNWKQAQSLLSNVTGWLVLVSWPYFLLVAFHHRTLAGIFSSGFVDDSSILVLLAVAMLVGSAAGPVDLTLLMLGRSKLSLAGLIAAITTNLVLLSVLTPLYGLAGAAIAWAVSVVVQNAVPTVAVWKISGLRAWGKPAWIAAGLALVATVPISLATDRSDFTDLIVGASVAGGIIVVGAFIFREALGLDELLRTREVSSR